MRCPICHSTDKWENVDKYRIKPEDMSLCSTCGFVSYPKLYKDKSEIIKYYENEYRHPPQVGNIFSGQRKLHYHNQFLGDLLETWVEEKKTKPVVTDIGAAFGMFLEMIRSQFPEGTYKGVELTKSFVRNAWHLYRIKLDQDFDDTLKYDLIGSYKSLEHIMDPDIELTRYIDALSDDGFLYLSVPIWFRTMSLFGSGGWSIDGYYHTNHINVWNLPQFEALIKICGGEIVKSDHVMYESTYLIKRNLDLRTDDRSAAYQDPKMIEECMNRIFSANEAFETANYREAVNIWPNFPYAYTAIYENHRKELHKLGFDSLYNQLIKQGLSGCPDEPDIQALAADVCMRYNQYEKAVEHLQNCQNMRPNMPNVYAALANVFRTLAEKSTCEEDKIKFYERSKEAAQMLKDTSLQNFSDSTDAIMFNNSKIPTPAEE